MGRVAGSAAVCHNIVSQMEIVHTKAHTTFEAPSYSLINSSKVTWG
jgi:hypothetical protein